MHKKWPQTALNGCDGSLYSSCVTCSKSQRSSRGEEWRPDGEMMEKCEQRRGEQGDGCWWLKDDEETVKRLAHSPLRGGLPLSLVVTSGLPPDLLLCGPGFARWRHILTEEFRNVFWGWTETQTPSFLFYSHSHYTTHAHHRNTCSTTAVQPQIVILWSCTLQWKLTYFQRFLATQPDPMTVSHNMLNGAHKSTVFNLEFGVSNMRKKKKFSTF